jgi:hypothetical protein
MRLERDSLGDLVLGGMVILKRVLNEEEVSVLMFHLPFINQIQKYIQRTNTL